jgi:hypothetical protein
VDTKNFPGIAATFTEDAIFDARQGHGDNGDDYLSEQGYLNGRPAILAQFDYLFIRLGSRMSSVHHGHTPEITITSPSTAKGIWALEDLVQWPKGEPVQSFHGFGHYNDEYVLTGEGWRTKLCVLTRIRVEFEQE